MTMGRTHTHTWKDPADATLGTPMAAPRTCSEGRVSFVTTIPHSPVVRDHPTPHGERRAAIIEKTVTRTPTNLASMVHAPNATPVAATVVCKASPHHLGQHGDRRLSCHLPPSHPRVRPAGLTPENA